MKNKLPKIGESIPIHGHRWTVHQAKATRIILVPDAGDLRAWRARAGLNQRAAAEAISAAGYAISQPQLARIESGTRSAAAELLALLTRLR